MKENEISITNLCDVNTPVLGVVATSGGRRTASNAIENTSETLSTYSKTRKTSKRSAEAAANVAETTAKASRRSAETAANLAEQSAQATKAAKRTELLSKMAKTGKKTVKLGLAGGAAYYFYTNKDDADKARGSCNAACLPKNWMDQQGGGNSDNLEYWTRETSKNNFKDKEGYEDWDWDTQPICLDNTKNNGCDTYCTSECAGLHESVLKEGSRILGSMVNDATSGATEGLGLDKIIEEIKTAFGSFFWVFYVILGIIILALFFWIFSMFKKKN
tara:strand:- start:68 stop:892 length:825 start_codon:yes stop_codon:yes gene_type:complete